MMFDAIIIGGSYAGLAAALQLARARRQVLVLDGAQPRNRFAHAAHGFLGYDGAAPDAIRERGRADVLAYDTTEIRSEVATAVAGAQGDFRVTTDGGEHRAKRLVLATGVADEMPAIPGLRERWGKSVFHCPYCHGYELGRGRIGVIAAHPMSIHQAVLVAEWSAPGQTRFFLEDAFEPDAQQLAQLAARGVALERRRITQVAGDAEVHVAGGEVFAFDGLFVATRTVIRDGFAAQLGCELEEGPLGAYYKTDMMKETTVPGVFACGDVGLPMGTVAFAVADGVRAGVATHQSLVFR
ncbi:MAG: NAD(P)/FAD-dependent oxidoreductase [Deltaproteobacteria bacterium]|nr:NAD(P)/FAD-dependent oxidoreductase [Deltaproteobacteria bacterium]MCW5805715.1 NAD(P)/FAD-dependent oxidoreductase [Deltaproteobacteria bacterium]